MIQILHSDESIYDDYIVLGLMSIRILSIINVYVLYYVYSTA